MCMRTAGDLQEREGVIGYISTRDKPGTVVIAGNEGYDLHKGTYKQHSETGRFEIK